MTNPSGRPTHWAIRKKEKDAWKMQVHVATHGKRPEKPLKLAKLSFTRASSVCPDSDGLVSGFKFIRDALIDCGIIENDKFENVGMPEHWWTKAPKGKGYVIVKIEELIGGGND